MRINKFLATHTSLSRRSADTAILDGRVLLNGVSAKTGSIVNAGDTVSLDGRLVERNDTPAIIIALHKPVGYVCSRDGQGSLTVYHLLPPELHDLKPAGRLDKDSSGLVVMTSDGDLAYKLTHPSFEKNKKYLVNLDRELSSVDLSKIREGIQVDDYLSRMTVKPLGQKNYEVVMHMGKNRQIRKTFKVLGYNVIDLLRTEFGEFTLGSIEVGKFVMVKK